MTPEEKARFREQIAAIPAAPGGSVPRCAHCGRDVEEKIDPDMGGNHHRWWVHVPGGYTPCNPQQGARSTKAEPAPPEGLRERLEAARSLADTLDARGTRSMDSDLCAAAGLLRLLAENVADRDRLAAEVAELRTKLTGRADGYTEARSYQVVGDWGVDSADSAEEARANVRRSLAAYPRCGAYAQWRIERTWDDGAEYVGPWQALDDETYDGTGEASC